MKKIKILLLNLLLISFVSNSFGQVRKNDPPAPGNIYDTPTWVRATEQQRDRMNEQHGRGKNGMIIQPPAESRRNRPMTEEEKEALEENLKNFQLTLKRLQAPAAYYKKYASFLKDDDTGLARLFVDVNCDEGKTVSVEELERCGDFIPVKGGGSYYSFRARTNAGYLKEWWDIHFANEKLKVGNDSVQAIIADVGNIDLEKIKLDSKAFEFLKKYKAEETVEEVKKQNKVLENGIEFNNFTYSNSAFVNLDSTYVLRSIAYRLDGTAAYEPENKLSGLNRFYSSGRGMDVIVAFRIVGREEDGSLILLWKELKTELPRRKLK